MKHPGSHTAARRRLVEPLRRPLILAVALLAGCAVIAVGCGGSDTKGALPPGWVTFQDESISLALPDSFSGT